MKHLDWRQYGMCSTIAGWLVILLTELIDQPFLSEQWNEKDFV